MAGNSARRSQGIRGQGPLPLTGKIETHIDSTAVLGHGTNFVDEIEVGDRISSDNAGRVSIRTVVSISAPDQLTVESPYNDYSDELDANRLPALFRIDDDS